MRGHSHLFCILLIWTNMFSGAQSPRPVTLQSPTEAKIAVDVSNVTYSCTTGIRFSWHITNTSQETVYVYSPFLQGQAADSLEYDATTSTVLIPTSVKGEASQPPYSYPEPVFIPLAPHAQIGGDFHEPISQQLSCKSLRPKKLIFEIAWGTDTTRVLTEISRIRKEGLVHPANPIVHWANLARSEPTSIKYPGGK